MFQEILDWSEVWALLIPLVVLLIYRKQPGYFRPIIIYLCIALAINLLIDVGWRFLEIQKIAAKIGLKFNSDIPGWLSPNNYLYNIHSIVRFICFSTFFILLKQPFLTQLKKNLPFFSLLLILINFTFFENFFNPKLFSSRLLAAEAGLLLFYCLQYYLYKLLEENAVAKNQKDFWLVMGLSIYVCFNFPYFLLYSTLKLEDAVYWWNFHNISYIILCIFIAKAFYVSGNRH